MAQRKVIRPKTTAGTHTVLRAARSQKGSGEPKHWVRTRNAKERMTRKSLTGMESFTKNYVNGKIKGLDIPEKEDNMQVHIHTQEY